MIIPSIDISKGRAVQLLGGKTFVLDGGDPMEKLDTFSVAGEVAVVDLDAAWGDGDNSELIRMMSRTSPIRLGGGIRSIEQAMKWLDLGVKTIVIGTRASPEFCRQLPKERIVAAVDSRNGNVLTEGWKKETKVHVLEQVSRLAPFVGGFLFTQVEHEGAESGFDLEAVKAVQERSQGAKITYAGGVTTPKEIRTLDELGIDSQVGMALYSGRLSLSSGIASTLRNPTSDGLWPTVICDRNDRVLGLVWSSAESLASAVSTRNGVYWSRSRKRLWTKGETSGNGQKLIRIEQDCDRDALKFVVDQQGPFCHQNTLACWPRSFDLDQLHGRISRSIQDGNPASGSVKLAANPDLLASKLREEINELIASSTESGLVQEAADVLYFLLVALASNNIGLDDVRSELQRRSLVLSRRPMQVKP